MPAGDKPLTWSEWRVVKAQHAYQKELAELRTAAGTLTSLMNDLPDPVRAQLAAETIQRLTETGLPALAYQRGKLALAAQAASDWAVGAIDRKTALQALDQALQVLSSQPSTDLPHETAPDFRSDPRDPGILPGATRR